MDFFDRHKALIITCLFCSVLVLALYNFSLSSKNKATKELLVNLENFKMEEPIKEEPQPKPEAEPKEAKKSTFQTHQAFNENQEKRDESFDKQLQEIFEKNTTSQSESSDLESTGTSGNFNFQEKKKEEKKRSDGDNISEKISTKSGGYDNSTISFSLVGRTARNIPNPVYTCDREGKVVINITVDENGRVINTSINKASSSTTNECLTDQALQYASQALFSSLAGRKSQPGTITYNFKP